MYSVYDQMVQKGIEQGIEQGKIIAYKTIALDMFKMGMDIERISMAVEYDIDTIEEWINNCKNK